MARKERFDSEDQLARRLEQVHQAMIDSRRRSGDDSTRVLPDHRAGSEDQRAEPNDEAIDEAICSATEILRLIASAKQLGIEPVSRRPANLELGEDLDQWAADLNAGDWPDEIPRRFGRFEIVRQLGQGGYGTVFLAHDPNLERDVALKFPRPEALLTPELKQRFVQEAKSASLLSHPNIVSVFEAGKVGGIYFIAYQYVPGPALDQWLTNLRDSLTPRQSAEIVSVLADAVSHAHDRGVIHRDLKPSNVLLEMDTDDGNQSAADVETAGDARSLPKPPQRSMGERLRIADFGLAKSMSDATRQTRTGALVGTPAYMAPEQTGGRNQEVGPESDIYSLGVILYELLTGQLPFRGDTVMQTVRQVQENDPAPLRRINPTVPYDLEAICLKCLEKDAARRYASAFELQRDLRNYLLGFPVQARRITRLDRLARWVRRNPAFASLCGFAIGSLLVAVAALAIGWSSTQSALRRESAAKIDAQQRYFQIKQTIDTYFNKVCENPRIKSLPETEPLRQELLELALVYYEQFVQEATDDPTLSTEIARTRIQIGEILAELGRPSDSIGLFESALKSIENELTVQPDDNELLLSKSRALDGAAKARFELGDAIAARELNASAIAICSSLIADRPSDLELTRRLAEYENRRGFICYGTDDAQNAKAAFENAVKAFATLVEQNPNDSALLERQLVSRRMIAASLRKLGRSQEAEQVLLEVRQELAALIQRDPTLWPVSVNYVTSSLILADLCIFKHDLQRAEEVLLEAAPIADTLCRVHPELKQYLTMKLGTNEKLGIVCMMQGKTDLGRQYLEQALDTAERALTVDPSSVGAIRGVATALYNLGCANRDHGEVDEAERLFIRAKGLIGKLSGTSRQSLETELSLARCVIALAGIAEKRSDLTQAIDYVDEAMAVVQSFLPKHAEHPMVVQLVIMTHDKRSEILDRLGRFEEAVVDRRRCLELAPGPTKPLFQAALALALIKNGKFREAIEITSSLESDNELKPDPAVPEHVKKFSYRLSQCHAVLANRQYSPATSEEQYEEHIQAALLYLRLAHDQGYFSSEQVIEDFNLDQEFESLRDRSEFLEFVATLNSGN